MKHNILNLRTTRPLYFDGETLQKLGNQDAASGCGEKRRICRDAFEPSPRLFLTARIRRFTQWVVGRIYIYIRGSMGFTTLSLSMTKKSWGYNEPKSEISPTKVKI